MGKILLFLVFLMSCSSFCDLCGEWSFERFEYAGHITTDCKDTANRFYKNSHIIIDKDSFAKTYHPDNIQNEIKNIHIVSGEYDSDEQAQKFFIKSGNKTVEIFYKSTPDSIYLLSDGCRFYFKSTQL